MYVCWCSESFRLDKLIDICSPGIGRPDVDESSLYFPFLFPSGEDECGWALFLSGSASHPATTHLVRALLRAYSCDSLTAGFDFYSVCAAGLILTRVDQRVDQKVDQFSRRYPRGEPIFVPFRRLYPCGQRVSEMQLPSKPPRCIIH